MTPSGHRPAWLRLPACLAILIAVCGIAGAAEVIPPSPGAYFNDFAGIVSAPTAQRLNETLDQFERETSNQVVVAIYPTMQSDSSVEDYTVRVAQSWHAGLKGKDNGAILFVFVDSHQIYIQVGYGLEPVLPDAICKRIISDEIAPRFRSGDYDGGMTAAVNSIIAATKGEYHGTGHTVGDRRANDAGGLATFGLVILFFILANLINYWQRRGSVYGSSGHGFVSGMLMGMLLNSGGSRGGGGGGGGFGGGGFSGGGGGFGGGGAGGSW